MDTSTLISIAAGIGGIVVGGFGAWLLNHRRDLQPPPCGPSVFDVDLDDEIDNVASMWAAANGQSVRAARLVADKLRLLRRVGQHPGRQRSARRWWR
jgi:hypothetical protein